MSFYTSEELAQIGLRSYGDNTLISRKSSIYGAERISLGSNVRIDDFCVLSAGDGGISIGRNVHIAIMSSIIGKGSIEIQDFCNLSSRVSVYSSSDDYSGEYMTNPTVPAKFTNVDNRGVVLGRHVIIGSGSVILPGVIVGENTAVGALSLVTKSIGPNGIYAGKPLKRIKDRGTRLLVLEKNYVHSSRSS